MLRTSAATAFGAPRRVLRPCRSPAAPLDTSVMSSMVPLFDHCAHSLRTRQVQARLVAFDDIAPLDAVGLAVLVLVTGFRTTPCTCVRPNAGASASLLRTTPIGSVRTLRHSSAVAAPSAGSSGTVSPSLVPLVSSFPTACAGSGSHTRRTLGAVAACLRLYAPSPPFFRHPTPPS